VSRNSACLASRYW